MVFCAFFISDSNNKLKRKQAYTSSIHASFSPKGYFVNEMMVCINVNVKDFIFHNTSNYASECTLVIQGKFSSIINLNFNLQKIHIFDLT